MAKRTDTHRPGAINPTEYRIAVYYARASVMDGWPVPPLNIDRVIEVQQAHRASGRGSMFGSIGKCGVCGAVYVEGELWHHDATGDIVHVGRDCAAKYELIGDVIAEREYQSARDGARRVTAAQVIKEQKREERDELLTAHPGLEQDLQIDHHIIADIAAQFQQRRSLSDAQVALVQKIADQVRNPSAGEAHVPAPLGKGVTFEGEIVSVKLQVSEQYGATWRMTVKVLTEGGSWLAWGTVPAAIVPPPTGSSYRDDEDQRERQVRSALRGRTVKIKATLVAGRESHFAIMKRPRAELVALPTSSEPAECGAPDTVEA